MLRIQLITLLPPTTVLTFSRFSFNGVKRASYGLIWASNLPWTHHIMKWTCGKNFGNFSEICLKTSFRWCIIHAFSPKNHVSVSKITPSTLWETSISTVSDQNTNCVTSYDCFDFFSIVCRQYASCALCVGTMPSVPCVWTLCLALLSVPCMWALCVALPWLNLRCLA